VACGVEPGEVLDGIGVNVAYRCALAITQVQFGGVAGQAACGQMSYRGFRAE